MLDGDTGADNTAEEASQSVPSSGEANATPNAERQVDPADSSGADHGTRGDPNPGSSANSDTTLQTAQNGQNARLPQSPDEWRSHLQRIEKRRADVELYSNQQTKELQRLQREHQEYQQRYQGIDPQEINRWRQAQQEAQQRNLKRWEPRHPEHNKFQATMAKRDALNAQIGKLRNRGDLSPEQKQALETEMVETALTPEERTELMEHAGMNRDFMLNPVANAKQVARDEAMTVFREMWANETRRMNAEQSVQKDLANPVLAQLAADPRMNEKMSAIMQGLTEGTLSPWQIAKHIALLETQVGSLQSRAGEADQYRSQASEQQRLLQQGASHTRDAAAVPRRDIYKEARRIANEQGLPHGHPKFMQIVRDLERTMHR
jgi:hypothetical protein